jgi:exodeoxyribonuclease VII large subunit
MREIAGQGPAKTLGQGFAINRSADGAPVTSAAAVTPHARFQIQVRNRSIAEQTIEPDESTSP